MSFVTLHQWQRGPFACRFGKFGQHYSIQYAGETNGCIELSAMVGEEFARLAEKALAMEDALRYAHDHLALDHEGPGGEPDWLLKKIRAAIDKAEGR